MRQRLAEGRPSRVLLIANSGPERRPLPLCETISRLTAEEFKNCGVAVDEFYGKLADSPEVLGGGEEGGIDPLRGPPGVSGPLRRPVGPSGHGAGQLL